MITHGLSRAIMPLALAALLIGGTAPALVGRESATLLAVFAAPFWGLLALHACLNLDYCMRCPVGRFNAVKAFVASGERERWVAISPCDEARRACERNGLGTAPIRVRLVRVDLPNGEVEVLITSLGQAIPANELAALYHLRWGIEEAYKLHKCRGELENFSGRTVRAVYQDVFAKLFSMNMAAMCAFAAADQAQQAEGGEGEGGGFGDRALTVV